MKMHKYLIIVHFQLRYFFSLIFDCCVWLLRGRPQIQLRLYVYLTGDFCSQTPSCIHRRIPATPRLKLCFRHLACGPM